MGPDDHGDGPNSATRISTGTSATFGRLQYRKDEDWFEFSASTAGNYRLTFEGPTGRVLPVVEVYLSSNLQTPLFTRQNPTIDFSVPSSGTAFLVMYLPDGTQGSYEFHFEE